jgi:hypothetical protein
MSPPAWISSAGISSLPGDVYLFNFAIATSTSKGLGSGTNGSAVLIFDIGHLYLFYQMCVFFTLICLTSHIT